MSLLRHTDPDRSWRPLVAEPIQFCGLKDNTTDQNSSSSSTKTSYVDPVRNISTILSRKRRSESRELHLEVLVVADNKMANYHGSNLKHYILTLMSTVALIYKDPSIGNNINLAVVDIVVLNETSDRDVIHHIAPITLRKFCRWQQKHNKLDDRDPAHYDTAILITREDLCRFPGACDTLGLAQSGMVCDSYSSCAIIEDNGLSAAFTIAHELGHVMSIPHDDDSKCSKHHAEKKKLHVMARMLDYNSHPWSWSECSRQYLTTFFDVGYGRCLTDTPSRNLLLQDEEFQQPPGQLYPRDQQCQLVFGPKSRICPYMPECKRLWCTMDDVSQGGCRTQHMPWADGTHCGEGKRCFQGECVRHRPANLAPIDGQWGKWMPFGKCSRTCGGGIQQAFRECDSPKPAHGGRYCTGIRVRYKSCNSQDCPAGSIDFREAQCAEFNGRSLDFAGLPSPVKWEPQYTGITTYDKCKLYCKVVGSTLYFVLREKVIDGTTCEPGTFDICVNGNCEFAGCDHVLHSNKTLDHCGVCGGSNNTCREISGQFNKKIDYGYHDVVMIPPGASNMRISQHSSDEEIDDNYIALKDADENYILNGDFMISMFPKTLQYHGTTIDYSGSDSAVEYVNSSKSLTRDLFVQVLVVGKLQPPNISFSYTVPVSDHELYMWKLATEYTQCSRICNGVSYLRLICVRSSDFLPVTDDHCHSINLPKPNMEKSRKCNEHCKLKWQDVSKSECSVQCGRGIRYKIIKCMKEIMSSKISHVVPEELCSHLGPKPELQEKCRGTCLNSSWICTDWSDCSVSCGIGTQQRSCNCKNSENENQPDSHCDPTTKLTSRSCDLGACPQWKAGDWTDCSVTCGKGERQRPIMCQYGNKSINSRYCKSELTPKTKQMCSLNDCYHWKTDEWEPCTNLCNEETHRQVYCTSSSGEKVDERYCSNTVRPSTHMNCSSEKLCVTPKKARLQKNDLTNTVKDRTSATRVLNDVNSISELDRAVWKVGSWSKCTATCGDSTRSRNVTCHDSYDDSRITSSHCDSRTKPKSSDVCFERVCGRWEVGKWTECSCERGVRNREVYCLTLSGERGEDYFCDKKSKPSMTEECTCAHSSSHVRHHHQNYEWTVGEWSKCSTTCGGGTQRRQVGCYTNEGISSTHCNEQRKPSETAECSNGPCPDWSVGEWSKCSNKCGDGTQHRSVHCFSDHSKQLSEESCDSSKKPDHQRACADDHGCKEITIKHSWKTGSWSDCSVSCGEGVSHRRVRCVDHEGKEENANKCPSPQPVVMRKCMAMSCPKWKWSEWSECSSLCGKGIQTRYSYCAVKDRSMKNGDCSLPNPSEEKRECINNSCTFQWRKGTWSPCNTACGSGFKVREVVCVNQGNTRAPSRHCTSMKKPKRRRQCKLKPCPYTWIVGHWSECSRTCDEGYQTRTVVCHELNDYGWPSPDAVGSNAERHCSSYNPRPKNIQKCNYGDCRRGFMWKPGPWSSCTGTCEEANQKRKLGCFALNGDKVRNKLCSATLKPAKKQRCTNSLQCPAESCKDVQLSTKTTSDGEYNINIRGKVVRIYCHGMNTNTPVEYVSLRTNNFAEIHSANSDYQYTYTDSCRSNHIVDGCDCNRHDYGYTVFYKIAFNISTLKVKADDFTFSETYYGRPVPYATAGDCYRSPNCPLGKFEISLEHTGLRVASKTSWTSMSRIHITLSRKLNDQVVSGRCGGFCDSCIPNPQLGLLLDVAPP